MHFALVAIAELTHDGPPIVENLVTNAHTYVDHVTFDERDGRERARFEQLRKYP